MKLGFGVFVQVTGESGTNWEEGVGWGGVGGGGVPVN